MRFKHHSGIRLALTSGHVTQIGTQWQALLPVFHAEALARGCQCERRPPPEVAEERASHGPVVEPITGGAHAKPAPAKKRPVVAKAAIAAAV